MTALEREIYNTVSHNAGLFLNEGAKHMFDLEGNLLPTLSVDDFVLAVSNLQIAMELAIRSYILYNKGIKPLLYKSDREKTEADLRTLYETKRLKVLDFETISNQLKGIDYQDLKLTREQRNLMSNFQTYRNKLLHFACPIEINDINSLRKSLLLYSINTVMYLLSNKYTDKYPPEMFMDFTGRDFLHNLHFDKTYCDAVREVAEKSGNTIWQCPMCNNDTYSLEEEYCYCCGFMGSHLHRTDCEGCGTKQSVIYDTGAHVIGHPFLYSGFCQKCEQMNVIYECPKCHEAYFYDFFDDESKCNESRCVNIIDHGDTD